MPVEMSVAKQRLSSVELFVRRYAQDILGKEKVDMLCEERYQPYWKAGGILMVGFFLMYGAFGQLISNLVGFIYPTYCSFKALETKHSHDDTKWLTYWVVFGFMSVIDSFADVILAVVPFYWLAKVVFLAWCFAPYDHNGSGFVYSSLVKPFFLKHEKKLDKVMNKVDKIMNPLREESISTNGSDIDQQFEHFLVTSAQEI